MTEQTYNQALVELAQAGLAALAARTDSPNALKTAAAESHFICSWMAQSLKERRFSKLVADDLNHWIRDGRSMGAAANLPGLLARIDQQYRAAMDNHTIGASLQTMLDSLNEDDWLVIVDCEVSGKLKLDSDGRNSLIISVEQYEQHIAEGKLLKPITLYVRSDEQALAKLAAEHQLLLSAGNKKASLIKHHKAYKLYPNNRQPALALLVK